MKITILTPSYNQAQYIEDNLLSVLNQRYADIEHIVMDGGSTDSTVEILKKYPSIRWVSQKDEGQADALQKGLEMATGDIVGWINSDDYLAPGSLDYVAHCFQSSAIDWIIGNMSFVLEDGTIVVDKHYKKITKSSLLSNPDILRQQGAFFKRQLLIETGGFNKQFQLTMDLDLWFRLLKISEPLMVDQNLAFFRVHDHQKTTGKCINKQLREILTIFEENDATWYHCLKIRIRKRRLQLQILLSNFLKKIKWHADDADVRDDHR